MAFYKNLVGCCRGFGEFVEAILCFLFMRSFLFFVFSLSSLMIIRLYWSDSTDTGNTTFLRSLPAKYFVFYSAFRCQ